MDDSAIFTGLIVVISLSSCHTLMTIRRECLKSTETIIKHIDERSSAFSQNFRSLTADNTFIVKDPQSNSFIVVGNHSPSNAVPSENRNKILKSRGNFGEDQFKPILPISQITPLQKNTNTLRDTEPNKAVNDCINQIPNRSRDSFNGADNADDVFHGTNDKAQKINKSTTEAA